MKLNKYIDHTLLKPEATKEQIEKIIEEAKEYDFASVCVNPTWVKLAAEELSGSDVKVCTELNAYWLCNLKLNSSHSLAGRFGFGKNIPILNRYGNQYWRSQVW